LRVVTSLPFRVVEIEHSWIPLADGCRLAARLWLPEGAEREPVPALLEYIPYGKREGTRERDEPMHRYFAGHGYAAVRVDLRGSGDSEGILRDEYLEQELRDGVEVIDWIASRPWCTGAVGMIGKSWGGFNALQIAERRPPALGGVISVCASDDRYADDAHYMGGCLLLENFRWGATLFALAAHPPDPALLGERWRPLWLARLAAAEPFALRWLEHPLRDEYWRHGSVAEDRSRIVCPVFAVGGWADGYTNAVPRLVAGLAAPCRGLVGPWGHVYPHQGVPGPAIGFLQEALRFFDHCLRGERGASDDPAYRVWMQESVPPADAHPRRAGRWVAEAGWPSPNVKPWRLFLDEDGLVEATVGDGAPLRHRSRQATGLTAGVWCGFGSARDMPGDQREDDARSLCFDSPPLAGRLEILGSPVLSLSLAVDRPVAFVAARLTAVAPDGTSTLVTYGVRNLTHDDAHATIRPVVPGERRVVTLALNDVACAFPAGHRVRLALATSHWPVVWPSPEPVTLTLFAGAGWLELPVRPPRPEDAALRAFPEPEAAPAPAVVDLDSHRVERRVERNPETGEVVIVTEHDLVDGRPSMSRIPAIDLQVGYGVRERMRIRDDDPLAALAETEHVSVLGRGDWSVRVETRQRITASAESFRLEAELRACEGEREVFARRWDERVPRRGV